MANPSDPPAMTPEALKELIEAAHRETRAVFQEIGGTMSPWSAAAQSADYFRETLHDSLRASAQPAPAPQETDRDRLKDLLQQALNQRGILCPLAYAGRHSDRSNPDHRAECPRCAAEDLLTPGWYVNPETAAR